VNPLVVDGGSTDGTLQVASTLGVPVLPQRGRGKGGAVREALEFLRTEGVRYAVVLDADRTYPGEAIGPALALLGAGSQLVVGIRQLAPLQVRRLRTVTHRVGNNLLNYLATQLSHHSILDLCSGFWALDLRAGIDRTLATTGFDIEAELFLSAYRQGLTVTQIPIAYLKRVGQPKLRAFRDGFRIFLTILRVGPSAKHTPPAWRTGAPGTLARDVLSICLVHSPRELVVVSTASRAEEASALANRMRGTGLNPHVVLMPGSDTPTSPLGIELGEFTQVDAQRAIVILPEAPIASPDGSPSAAVVLPRTRRLVYVGGDPSFSISGARKALDPVLGAATSAGGYSLEIRPPPTGHLRWVRALGNQINFSPDNKELAMINANNGRASVSVWKRDQNRGSAEEDRPPFSPTVP